jgi:NADH-quinone oxidoreductase subunit D
MVARIGGLSVDADDGWLGAETALMARVRTAAEQTDAALAGAQGSGLGSGVAPVDAGTVAAFGLGGVLARASGVDLDLRRTPTSLVYDELLPLLRPAPGIDGDARTRFRVQLAEVVDACAMVEACAARLADLPGPVEVRLGKIVKLPEGEAYLALEAPLGVAGFFVVSRGEKTPWRFKLRTPSFSNAAALERVLVGVPVVDLETALASVGYVVGDIDR